MFKSSPQLLYWPKQRQISGTRVFNPTHSWRLKSPSTARPWDLLPLGIRTLQTHSLNWIHKHSRYPDLCRFLWIFLLYGSQIDLISSRSDKSVSNVNNDIPESESCATTSKLSLWQYFSIVVRTYLHYSNDLTLKISSVSILSAGLHLV